MDSGADAWRETQNYPHHPNTLLHNANQTCVERFQLITVDCMLIRVGARAAMEQQAGVMDVVMDVEGGDFNNWGPKEYAYYARWHVGDMSIA
ncbi:MAG: hypothetical protein Q9176_004033 [Flavoplaca citrina]